MHSCTHPLILSSYHLIITSRQTLARQSPRWWSHHLLSPHRHPSIYHIDTNATPLISTSTRASSWLARGALSFDFEQAWFSSLEQGLVDVHREPPSGPLSAQGGESTRLFGLSHVIRAHYADNTNTTTTVPAITSDNTTSAADGSANASADSRGNSGNDDNSVGVSNANSGSGSSSSGGSSGGVPFTFMNETYGLLDAADTAEGFLSSHNITSLHILSSPPLLPSHTLQTHTLSSSPLTTSPNPPSPFSLGTKCPFIAIIPPEPRFSRLSGYHSRQQRWSLRQGQGLAQGSGLAQGQGPGQGVGLAQGPGLAQGNHHTNNYEQWWPYLYEVLTHQWCSLLMAFQASSGIVAPTPTLSSSTSSFTSQQQLFSSTMTPSFMSASSSSSGDPP